MERLRFRPLFKLELPMEAPQLLACIERRLAEPDARFMGTVLKRHVNLTVRAEERHFWSPHLSLDVLAEDDGTKLRGRYAPHTSIWTGIMSLYALLAFIALAGSMFGTSQWILHRTPWALWAIPVSALCAAVVWFAAGVGQKLAEEQMHALHEFFEACLQHASDPPEAA